MWLCLYTVRGLTERQIRELLEGCVFSMEGEGENVMEYKLKYFTLNYLYLKGFPTVKLTININDSFIPREEHTYSMSPDKRNVFVVTFLKDCSAQLSM